MLKRFFKLCRWAAVITLLCNCVGCSDAQMRENIGTTATTVIDNIGDFASSAATSLKDTFFPTTVPAPTPAEVGTAWNDFRFSMNGVGLQLPMSYTDWLSKTGFVPDKEYGEETMVGAKSTLEISGMINSSTLTLQIYNGGDAEVAVANGQVVGVEICAYDAEASKSSGADLYFVAQGNITLDSAYDDCVAAFGVPTSDSEAEFDAVRFVEWSDGSAAKVSISFESGSKKIFYIVLRNG